MTTETLHKLYLEWSQFTKAQTSKEIALKKLADDYGIALMMIREGCADPVGVARRALEATPVATSGQIFVVDGPAVENP